MSEQIDFETQGRQLSDEAEQAFNAMFARYQEWMDYLVLCTPRYIDSFVISAAKACVARDIAREDLAVAKAKLADYLRRHHL